MITIGVCSSPLFGVTLHRHLSAALHLSHSPHPAEQEKPATPARVNHNADPLKTPRQSSLGPGEEPGDLLGSDSYAPLVKIIAALRSHDAKVVEALAVPQKSGKRTKGRSAEAVVPPGQSTVEGVPSFTLPVRFQSDVDADTLALFVSMRVLSS